MYHEAFETDSDMQKWDSGCWIRYKLFENALDNMPTIERHGRWIKIGHPWYECSECGERTAVVNLNGEVVWNYCPNCGAKMEKR